MKRFQILKNTISVVVPVELVAQLVMAAMVVTQVQVVPVVLVVLVVMLLKLETQIITSLNLILTKRE